MIGSKRNCPLITLVAVSGLLNASALSPAVNTSGGRKKEEKNGTIYEQASKGK
jgi:hypothetical protein